MHDHSHHDHAHAHAPADFGRAFAIGTALNLAFVAAEAAAGIAVNSTALLADAGHNLSDVAGLLIAWGASALSKRPPSARYTYGLRGTSILAALANAIVLMIALGAIAWEATLRFSAPKPVEGGVVMLVAAIGVGINAATAMLFMSGRKSDINIRGAYLHMVADAAVSLGVVAAGALIYFTGALWIDPVTSLVIAAVVAWGTWSLLTESLRMSLAGVPAGIELSAIQTWLEQRPGISNVHDLHVWPMSTTEIALTAHLVMPDGHPGDPFLIALSHDLHHRFGIAHPTLQIEIDPQTQCDLAMHTKV